MKPPRMAEWLLRCFTSPGDRRFLLADAAEEYERLAASHGRREAARWYWQQALTSIRPLSGERARRRFRQMRQVRISRVGVTADFAQALRFIRRYPLMAVSIIGTLATAIAASLATFTIVDAVILRPLPFPSADHIVTVRVTGPTIARAVTSSSRPNFEDWRERSRAFAAMGAYTPQEYRLTGRGEPREITAVRTSQDLASVFGVQPFLGRLFVETDFKFGAQPVVVLTHGFWVSEFGANPAAIGQPLQLDGRSHEIVGVLPDAGMFVPPGEHQAWVPLIPREGAFWEHSRATGWLFVAGRIRNGVTIEQADADLSNVAHQLATQYPDSNRGRTDAELVRLRDQLLGPVAPMLYLIAGALFAVLMIACANIGSLLVASAASRTREFAVRSAIGAGRMQLVRQIGVETLVLCGAASTVGLLASPLLVRAFLGLYPNPLPRAVPQGEYLALAAPAAFLGLIVAAFLAVPQVVQIGRVSARSDVSGTTRTTAGRSARAGRAVLVTLQVALSFVLISAGVSFVRTVDRLHNVDTGYRSDGVLAFNVSPSPLESSGPSALQFYSDVISAAGAVPGATAAGAAVAVPMTSSGWRFGVRPPGATADVLVAVNLASPGYFDVLGIRLLEGRFLTADEQLRGSNVAVVNEPLARVLGGKVVGRKLNYSGTSWEIVGVTGGVRHGRPQDEPMPELLIPWHMAGRRPQAIVVRAQGDPLHLLPAISARVHAIDPTAPLSDVARLDDRLRDAVGMERFRATLLAALATVAVALAALGAYSVTAFAVGRRAREYGIRLALGEMPLSIGLRALGTAVLPALAGVLIGAATTAASAHWIQTFLYAVSASDAITIAGTAVTLLAISLLAGGSSARRAATIDPVATLSAE